MIKSSLIGGRFTNHSGAVMNMENGSLLIANVTNEGIFNANTGSTFHASVNSFINNGVFNVELLTLDFPITSTVSDSSINFQNNFTTNNTISGVHTITLNGAGSTFNVQNAITDLELLTMGAGMETSINVGGSITTSTLVLNDEGTLTLNGGNFAGNLVGTANTTLDILDNFSTSGFISGVGTINALVGTFTINDPILDYDIFQNSSDVIMNGGSLSGGMRGDGLNSTLVINRDFTTAGVLGEGLPLGSLNINPGATLTMNHDINAGDFTNNGNLALSTSETFTGDYLQNANGRFTTTIQKTGFNNFGQLQILGNATVGGNISVRLNGGSEVNDQDTFDVMTFTGAFVDNNPSVSTSPNLFLSFSRDTRASVPPDVIRLIARRRTFSSFVSNEPSIAGVAATLDSFDFNQSSGPLRDVLFALRTVSSQSQLEDDLSQLIPEINGASFMTSLATGNLILEKIDNRLTRSRSRNRYRPYPYRTVDLGRENSGYSAGDRYGSDWEFGPFIFGNVLRQDNRGIVEGYHSNTGGIGALADAWITDWAKIGGAVSYARTGIKTNHFANETKINTFMGSIYGSLDYYCWFVDGIATFGINDYSTTRNMWFVQSTANGSFNGYQDNEIIRTGVNIPIDILQFTPLALIQHAGLHQDKYTETGTGLNLIVNSRTQSALRAGVGLKVMPDFSETDPFLPEMHAMWFEDLKSSNLDVTSSFTVGGPAFVAIGPRLPKSAWNIGLGLRAQVSCDLFLSFQYDYESRKHFNSHTALLKLDFLF